MKPSGPLNERETIVRWSDEDDSVEIWTASGRTDRVCRKLGLDCVEDGERHSVFKATTKNVTLRKVRKLTPERAAQLATRMKLARSKQVVQSAGEQE